ncbi:hypothetical protein AVEN_125994-1 [Araneus ventricosus]|uniref:Uncharacterized protein n=1 Tax=Araneus ventricosus TaxID=182803 RepID=A0A4Y2PRX2_ARAVE|nr:hypothetical protein AVEN_125994-1 [Araneus ventricosus]
MWTVASGVPAQRGTSATSDTLDAVKTVRCYLLLLNKSTCEECGSENPSPDHTERKRPKVWKWLRGGRALDRSPRKLAKLFLRETGAERVKVYGIYGT